MVNELCTNKGHAKQKRKSVQRQTAERLDISSLMWRSNASPVPKPRKRPAPRNLFLTSEESDFDKATAAPSSDSSMKGRRLWRPVHKSVNMPQEHKQQEKTVANDASVLSDRANFKEENNESHQTEGMHPRRTENSNLLTPTPSLTRYSATPTVVGRSEAMPQKRARVTREAARGAADAHEAEVPSPRPRFQQPARKSSERGSQHQGDEEVRILDHWPLTPAQPAIKSEDTQPPVMNRLDLPANVIAATRLIVSASNQAELAPAIVRLSACVSIDTLFTKLISECDLGYETTKKISTISATYTWSGEKHRLRKGSEENFDLFCEILRTAWEREPARFVEGCKINMLLHVDS